MSDPVRRLPVPQTATPLDRAKAFAEALAVARGKHVLIVLRGHPDPDGIASALAQAHIGQRVGVGTTTIAYCHDLSHRENRALVKLLGRWRDQLETSVTPWEKRASIPDDIPEGAADAVKAGTLALASADDRPSQETLVATDDAPDEPWNKKSVPKEETALAATDPQTSLSRVGSVASDALTMPPLPPMRMTMPSLPTYGGPVLNVPPPPPKQFSGRTAALAVFILFVGLIAFGIIIFRWLLGPS
jgi:hypothetical protein